MASFVFLGYSRYVYRQLRYETDKYEIIQSGFLDKMYSGTGVPGAAVFCIGRTNSQGRMLWKINGRHYAKGFSVG